MRTLTSLAQWLPELNQREDLGDLAKLVECLDVVFFALLDDVDKWPQIFDRDLAPEAFLDVMLEDLGNTLTFAYSLSEIDKRRLLSVLVTMYRQKGTAQGIVNAIRFFLAYEAELVPANGVGLILGEDLLTDSWVLGFGTPWSFRVKVVTSNGTFTAAEADKIARIVAYMKPANTTAVSIYAALPAPGTLTVEATPGNLALLWSDPPSGSGYLYRIFLRELPGVTENNAQFLDTANLFANLMSVVGQTYAIRVAALLGNVVGELSNEVTTTGV